MQIFLKTMKLKEVILKKKLQRSSFYESIHKGSTNEYFPHKKKYRCVVYPDVFNYVRAAQKWKTLIPPIYPYPSFIYYL